MSDTSGGCCPDCGTDRSALLAEAYEANAASEAIRAEIRVLLEQRMQAGEDITSLLEVLEREGVDVASLLVG
ncbi:hypothetical protein G6W51_17050 [Streptomyces coelicolor]|nr:hypothetical protein [Streptomyces coelicolor]